MRVAELLETKGDLAIDEATYLDIIDRKTASLIESACAIGAGFHPGHVEHADEVPEDGRQQVIGGQAEQRIGIEVKNARRFHARDARVLEDMLERGLLSRALVLYRGTQRLREGSVEVWPVHEFLGELYHGALEGGS